MATPIIIQPKATSNILLDNSVDWARIQTMIDNAIANSGGGGGGSDDSLLELAEFVTYNELVEKRAKSELIPAKWYAITDYVTKVNDPNGEFISAEHPFAVLVQAVLPNELSEFARAARTYYEDYFENSFLTAWELKYSLDNDRFPWGDTENGKGIIYYMKDELGNECPYDFKNIMFKRYFETNLGTYVGVYDKENVSSHPAIPNYNIDSEDYIYLYTFSTVIDGELYDSSTGIELEGVGRVVLCHNNRIGFGSGMGDSLQNLQTAFTYTFSNLIGSNVLVSLINTDDYKYEDPMEQALAQAVMYLFCLQAYNEVSGNYNTLAISTLSSKVSGYHNLTLSEFSCKLEGCGECYVTSGAEILSVGLINVINSSVGVHIEGRGNQVNEGCNNCTINGNYNTIERCVEHVVLDGCDNVKVLPFVSSESFASLYDCYIGRNSNGETKVWNPADLVTT